MPKGVTPLSFLVIVHRKGLPSWKWGAQRAQRVTIYAGLMLVQACSLNQNILVQSRTIEPAKKGLKAETQVPLKVVFRNRVVGDFYADILVENLGIIELKAAKSIGTENEAQLINYLKATNKRVGLLVNFGKPKLEWKWFVY